LENDPQLGFDFSRAPQREPLPLAKHISSTSLKGWLQSRGGNDIQWSVAEQLGPASMLKPWGRLAQFSGRDMIGLSTPEWPFHDDTGSLNFSIDICG
jgi:hypothetical protein